MGIDGIRAPFLMERTIREAVHRLKYNSLPARASISVSLMMGFLDPRQLPIHALIPVLMHRGPERQRGENQAHLLAR